MAVGAFAGAAVARGAGGLLGVVAFVAYLAGGAAITVGREFLYERAIEGSSFYFIDVSAVQLALWQLPSAIAVVAGSLAGARLTRGDQGTNALLEATGAYSLVAAIVLVFVAGPSDPRLAPYSGVFAPAAVHIALVIAGATATTAAGAYTHTPKVPVLTRAVTTTSWTFTSTPEVWYANLAATTLPGL